MTKQLLLGKEITAVDSWDSWVTLWNQTSDIQQLLGLVQNGLHAGGHISHDVHKKVTFYLQLANGYSANLPDDNTPDFAEKHDSIPIAIPHSNGFGVMGTENARRTIAREAWRQLNVEILHSFKDDNNRVGWMLFYKGLGIDTWDHTWNKDEHDFALVKAFVEFFSSAHGCENLPYRIDDRKNRHYYLEESEHHYVSFLQWLIPAIWNYRYFNHDFEYLNLVSEEKRPETKARWEAENAQGRRVASYCNVIRPDLIDIAITHELWDVLIQLNEWPIVRDRLYTHFETWANSHTHDKPTLHKAARNGSKMAQVILMMRGVMM